MCEAAMRGKQPHVVDHDDDEDEPEDDEYLLKGGGPARDGEYLLKSGGPARDDIPAPTSGPGPGTGFWMSAVSAASGMEMIPESGFISSQPSMAEFILPHHMTDMAPSPGGASQSAYPQQPLDPQQPVQEYPWMKEKKTARKNNQQGK